MEHPVGQIILYQTPDGITQIDVQLDRDTVWLSLNQMGELFERDKSVISRHIKSLFKEGELEKNRVVAFFATTAADGKTYQVEYFNLDVIISVGYRVKSKRGTQFRIWANTVLKNYLLKGYALDKNRLRRQDALFQELEQTLSLVQGSISFDELPLAEARGMAQLIARYARSLALLNQFDSDQLDDEPLNRNITYEITYLEARQIIDLLKSELLEKREASDLFGRERDGSFQGILQTVVQTFGGEYLYPSIEQQAAHLLYFIIKNHPFSDGNKRIGALLFVWFLEKNRHLHGFRKINENALVALALLIAQSDPVLKELMIKLVINLINR